MDVDLSLDEIIERKRVKNASRGADKKQLGVQMKPRKAAVKQGLNTHTYDARNKIIQKTRAKIVDARDILNQNIRESGIDARNVLLERKKERMPMPLPLPVKTGRSPTRGVGGAGSLQKSRFAQRIIAMNKPPHAVIQRLFDLKKDRAGLGYKPRISSTAGLSYQPSRLDANATPFVPRGYVDYDDMQKQEDEEIAQTMHLANIHCPSSSAGPRVRMTRGYDDYDLDMDGVEITAPGGSALSNDPFSVYEAARNRVERPAMPPPPLGGGRREGVDKLFERRQRNLVATSNLPDALRARLFGSEPDRRVSHGIYANENGSGQSKGHMETHHMSSRSMHQRRSPPNVSMSLPLSVVNKPGYRLLVSNLHANVTTADIRELFNDIGPMYDAHVVRPGTAEVIYKSLEHAEMAVEAYHQREFDGQPMHCVLVNPHSSNRSTHSVSSRTVTTNSSGVEVDIDALHSVLFRDR
ncbi:uncharacterized protein LOC6586112 [Drosophila mojavensis]|uniref:RRM domain-containing protein n=1 Tax=Drosophila mojavensis TaxID=7230 RepID=B4L7L2_DROMO|nr:uncharacterized protein LOC6586112 [Drosophila mojavensis]EDW05725.1 uncharacterized protein Dmoj_GI10924 [Drosophila mojavensis]